MSATPSISLPFSAALYAEFILRTGRKDVDVGLWVEEIVEQFLQRTLGDAEIWSERHAEDVASQNIDLGELRAATGDPRKGYQWQVLFLPNGTKVRMLYQGRQHYADVQHEKLVYDGESLSPSEFASKVANGTNRNAWRDLYLQFPDGQDWEQADVVRKQRGGRR